MKNNDKKLFQIFKIYNIQNLKIINTCNRKNAAANKY